MPPSSPQADPARSVWSAKPLLIAIGLLVAVVAVWQLWPKAGGEEILARVGDSEITLDRFNNSYLQFLMASGAADTPVGRRGHLEKMIQNRLLAQEARQRGIGTGEAYDALVDRQTLLAAGGRYFEEEYAATLPPLTEGEVRDAYEKGMEKVILRQLYFRDPEAARAAHARLLEGMDFVDLANEVFQTAAYDSMAGYLGLATYWDLDDPIAEVAFEMKVGEVSPPIRSTQGWHVLRLEDRLVNPILVEEDFQRRRASIEGRARIRRNRLQGDAWVRARMEELDVKVNSSGMRQLAEVVQETLKQEPKDGQKSPGLLVSELNELKQDLRSDTPLLLYSFNGQDHSFLASDFYRWVPELAYDEIRDAPAAAVGRALRNEVLGLKGLEAGLDKDPRAQEAVQFVADLYLANQLRNHLRETSQVVPSEEQISEAFDRLGYGALTSAEATYWIIPFESFPEAEKAREQVVNGARRPESFEGYSYRANEDVLGGSLKGHVRRMTIGEPLVVCLADYSCNLVQVVQRTVARRTLDESREEITARLKNILPEELLTDSLRVGTPVWINEDLFLKNLQAR